MVKPDIFVVSVLVKESLSVNAGHVVMLATYTGTVTVGNLIIHLVMTIIIFRGDAGHVVILDTYTDTVIVEGRDIHVVLKTKSLGIAPRETFMEK